VTGSGYELALTALAAMLSPTTLLFSVFALVLSDRPLRTGIWFYAGALSATLAIGLVAAFVLGDAASSHESEPKTWVAVLDIVLGCALLVYVVVALRRPPNERRQQAMNERMSTVASSPAVAIVGAGAALANPGAFIPIALKDISQMDPSATQYIVEWTLFAVVSLLPLGIAILLLLVAREWAGGVLRRASEWLQANARVIAAAIVVVLAAALLRNGISGLS